MMSDAYVTVTCDKCMESNEEFDLTPLAGGGWDARGVDDKLEGWGWLVNGDEHICPDCQEEEE
ncbi:MAG: hypothetical protein EHM35_00180 [Planctomycetaceae bacterium]|nr:MAG: hypothetical protein EHM35_00180 [Planctomycetaceae bacterium]